MTDATRAGTAAEPALGIGTVLGQSFGVLRRHLPKFLLLALVVQGSMGALHALLLIGLPPVELTDVESWPADQQRAVAWQFGIRIAIVLVGYTVAAFLTIGGVTYITCNALSGRPARLGESIRVGLSRAPAMFTNGLAVVLVFGIVAVIGPFVIVFTGLAIWPLAIIGMFTYVGILILLMIRYSVVLPVAVVERLGLFGPLGRSAALTRGQHWRILGLGLGLVLWLLGMATVILGSALISAAEALGAGTPLIYTAVALAYLLAGLVSVLVITIVPAVLYHELRRLKEGVSADEIASVFD